LKPLAAILLLAAQVSTAQEPPILQSTSQEVILDLVVRDKKGRIVKDLRPSEIEILENGVPQKLRSLLLMEGGERIPLGEQSGQDSKQIDPLQNLRLITLSFDRMNPASRKQVRQAVQALLKEPIPSSAYISVVRLNPRLQVVQPYTRDPILLRWAVEKVTEGGVSEGEMPEIARPSRERAAPGSRADDFAAAQSRLLEKVEQRMEEFQREQVQGSLQDDSLLALTVGLRLIDGRKTVLLFSDWTGGMLGRAERELLLVGQANRANVAIYPVDARGLSAGPLSVESGIMRSSGLSGSGDVPLPATPGGGKGVQTAKLEELAASTGGFVIGAPGDLAAGVRKAEEEAFSHYLAAYSPDDRTWDGRFRTVQVRVTRPNVTIQSRSGYFALPPGMQTLLFPHEVPLLKALSTTPPPRAIEYRAGMYRFGRMAQGAVKSAFHIEIPMKNLSVSQNKAEGSYDAHVSFLVFVKDSTGKPVRKATRDVPFSGPLDKLTAFQAGNFVYDDYFPLPPGRYVMESAILDRIGQRVSTKRVSVIVPEVTASELALSSLVLVRRIDTDPPPEVHYGRDDDRGTDPYRFAGGKVLPTLDTTIAAGGPQQLTLFFTVYPDPRSGDKPRLWIEIVSEDKVVARSSLELPPAEADGKVPYLASISLSNLKSGSYEARVVARQGAESAVERVGFNIE
jgi:VWFA-related protein